MKNIYIIIFAVVLLASGSALAATNSATSPDPRSVEDQQVARLIGLLNRRFPDSAADLKTVTVHVDRNGQLRLVELIPRQSNTQTATFCRQLRHLNLGAAGGDGKEKRIKLTFLR